MKSILILPLFLFIFFLTGDAFAEKAPALSREAVKVTYETFTLPGNEKMGVLGLGVDHQLSSHFNLGVASYAAVRGERGGFITLGATAGFHYPLTKKLELDSGIFLGAGGGRGGYTLSGGGLMLRGHLGANYEIGSYGKLGVGASIVDFPNGGEISGVQPYVSYSIPFNAFIESGWANGGSRQLSREDEKRLSPTQHEFAIYWRNMMIPAGVRTDSGGLQRDYNLLGAEWRTYLTDYFFAKLESEGAAGGDSTGYMQILAGVGVRYPLASRLFVIASASTGGGGGGSVDTGGGLLVDGTLGLQYFLSDRWFVDVSGSHLEATSGSLKANSVGVKTGYQFGLPAKAGATGNGTFMYDPAYMRVRMTSQTYFKASDNWRSHHADENVDNLGVQVDYFVNPNWFITGQGLAAYGGNAGAYMTGLLGAGYQHPLSSKFFIEIEGLIGAAGGGGLEMGGGLAAQANLSLGYQLFDSTALMLTIGEIDSVRGDFRAHVAGASIVFTGKVFSK